jgi:hypothetical protein
VKTDLDELSSRELHDMAIHRALRHGDVRFLWDLLRTLPAAAELEGDPEEAGRDLTQVHALLADAIGSGEGAEAEALRPLYLDYLRRHSALWGAWTNPQPPGRRGIPSPLCRPQARGSVARSPGVAGRRPATPAGGRPRSRGGWRPCR